MGDVLLCVRAHFILSTGLFSIYYSKLRSSIAEILSRLMVQCNLALQWQKRCMSTLPAFASVSLKKYLERTNTNTPKKYQLGYSSCSSAKANLVRAWLPTALRPVWASTLGTIQVHCESGDPASWNWAAFVLRHWKEKLKLQTERTSWNHNRKWWLFLREKCFPIAHKWVSLSSVITCL